MGFQLKFDFGYFFIAGPQTPPPPNSGTPPQKVLSSRPILMKQKPKDRSWSKLSFRENFFEKVFKFFQKNQKQNFQKSANFGLNFFAYVSENSKKPKLFDLRYHFGDRPKKTFKLKKIKIS